MNYLKIYISFACLILFNTLMGASIEDVFLLKSDKDTAEIVKNLNLAQQFYSAENPDYDSAVNHLNEALDLAMRQSLDLYIYKVYDEFTNLLIDTKNYSLAADYYFKMLQMLDTASVRMSKQNPDLLFQYSLLYRYIGICMTMNEPEKGYEYSMKSLETLEQLAQIDPAYPGIDQTRLFIFNNIQASFIDSGDFERAFIYGEKALNYPVKIDMPSYYASLYNNLGIVYWELGRWEEAFDFYRKSFKIREELNDDWGTGIIYFNIGKSYFLQNDYKAALEALTMSKKIGHETTNVRIEMYSTDYLAKIYQEQKDYKQEAEMLQLSNSLKDSINNSDRANELTRREMQYLLEKQLRESELKQQILVSQKEQKVLIIVFVAILLSFLLLLFFLLYNNQRIKNKKNLLEQESLSLQNENLELKNQQLKQVLDNKTKELNSHMKYLLKKNEFVTEIIENVSDLKEQGNPKIEKTIGEIKDNIESSVWNEFNLLFQDLHQDFYQRLYEKHNNLTPNEKKLCAFIRLNLSTKEISSITFQSTKSLEIARSRLRKKLGLTRDENLSLYLSQF